MNSNYNELSQRLNNLKWVSTGLAENCIKKALNARVKEIVEKFTADFNSGEITKVKSASVDKTNVSESVLKDSANGTSGEYEFTDFLKYWLSTVKPTLAYTTFISYIRWQDYKIL